MSDSAKRVLIIGGTRFFGRGIVAALRDAGCAVAMLTRGQRAAGPPADDVEWMVGDRKDPETLRRIARERAFDAVIDNVCYERDDAVAAARAFNDRAGRYLLTSTVMSYLNGYLSGAPLGEADWARQSSTDGMLRQYNPGELNYARNKRACEEAFFAELPGRATAFRLHNVIGPDDFSGKSGAIVKALATEGRCRLPGRPDDTYQTVFADDVGRLYAAAVRADSIKPAYNVALPPIGQRRFVELLLSETSFGPDRAEFAGGDGAWGAEGLVCPFPRNVVLDTARLRRDFPDALRPYESYVPAMGRWYAAHEGVPA